MSGLTLNAPDGRTFTMTRGQLDGLVAAGILRPWGAQWREPGVGYVRVGAWDDVGRFGHGDRGGIMTPARFAPCAVFDTYLGAVWRIRDRATGRYIGGRYLARETALEECRRIAAEGCEARELAERVADILA